MFGESTHQTYSRLKSGALVLTLGLAIGLTVMGSPWAAYVWLMTILVFSLI